MLLNNINPIGEFFMKQFNNSSPPGGNEASATARFVNMMDKFFDALNVHNYTEGVYKRKRFKMPYTSSKDMRLKVCIQQ